MQNNWDEFWDKFIADNKLQSVIDEIDTILSKTSDFLIEDICHKVYNKYGVYSEELDVKRKDLIHDVEGLPGVHLLSSRTKTVESLLRKIIKKKHDWMMDSNNKYSILDDDNYERLMTDLIGIRLIISYRGSWKELHSHILKKFPLKDIDEYKENNQIPIDDNNDFIAEKPKVYYAYGDDVTVFKGEFVELKLKENGYRSVHYVVCYKGTYVELQMRTIFDEAWSECDHNYVYKHEQNISYPALKELSSILCTYTNTSSDFGDIIADIYNKSPIESINGDYYITKAELLEHINKIISRYSKAQTDLEHFKECLKLKEGVDHEEE